MGVVDLIITVGWAAFWVGWLAAAFGVKSGRTQWRRYVGFRVLVVLVLVTLGRLGAFRGHDSRDPVSGGIGLAVFVLGLAVAVWARVHLGRNWGAPMSEKDDPQLVTTGPYRWIRNPIYSGLIVALVGTAVAVNVDWLLLAGLIGGYFVYSAVMELRYMTQRFPESYPAYRNATKMLIPFVF